MSKLTWKAFTTATTLADPAVHGEGYQLRYRRRKGGVFAELRYKAGAGRWTAYRLGQVPSEAETRARFPRAQITARGQPVELPSTSAVPVERRSIRSERRRASWSRSFARAMIRAAPRARTA